VAIRDPDEDDLAVLEELLGLYHRELLSSHQDEEADWVEGVIARCRTAFVRIVPEPAPPVVPTDE
jgi:glutamate synthase (NADPH/NADH) large chain